MIPPVDFRKFEPTKQQLVKIVEEAALAHGLDPILMFALVEQESNWNPWAIRYEPAFYTHHVVPTHHKTILSESELRGRAISWGLFQIMGETARGFGNSKGGFKGKFLAELVQPNINAEFGCKTFRQMLDKALGDEGEALLLYNGGGNPDYDDEVIARKVHYLNS